MCELDTVIIYCLCHVDDFFLYATRYYSFNMRYFYVHRKLNSFLRLVLTSFGELQINVPVKGRFFWGGGIVLSQTKTTLRLKI